MTYPSSTAPVRNWIITTMPTVYVETYFTCSANTEDWQWITAGDHDSPSFTLNMRRCEYCKCVGPVDHSVCDRCGAPL